MINKANQEKISEAFRRGIACMRASDKEYDFLVENPFSINGAMPEVASVDGALWHAFEAGKLRALGDTRSAGTMMRNARFCMRRAMALGRDS